MIPPERKPMACRLRHGIAQQPAAQTPHSPAIAARDEAP